MRFNQGSIQIRGSLASTRKIQDTQRKSPVVWELKGNGGSEWMSANCPPLTLFIVFSELVDYSGVYLSSSIDLYC